MKSKKELRQGMLARRRALADSFVNENSMKIIESLLKLESFHSAKSIMTYASYPKEVQTDSFIIKALTLKKEVITPKCDKEMLNLIPIKIKGLHQLEKGFFGLREPNTLENTVSLSEIDLIIVPGVAFDRYGNRIGHGAGYYDHFLKNLPTNTLKIGFAFSYQIMEEKWSIDPWDVPVDLIVTENEVISPL